MPDRIDKSRQHVRVAVRDGGLRCLCCELDLYASDTYNVLDHVAPLGRGGSRGDDNVVIACRDCNGLKGQYVPNGVTAAKRIADAKRKVRQRRTARTNGGLRGVLDRLIEGRGPR
jgi:5-methylcytosine-specific restriction endonuclease McrA